MRLPRGRLKPAGWISLAALLALTSVLVSRSVTPAHHDAGPTAAGPLAAGLYWLKDSQQLVPQLDHGLIYYNMFAHGDLVLWSFTRAGAFVSMLVSPDASSLTLSGRIYGGSASVQKMCDFDFAVTDGRRTGAPSSPRYIYAAEDSDGRITCDDAVYSIRLAQRFFLYSSERIAYGEVEIYNTVPTSMTPGPRHNSPRRLQFRIGDPVSQPLCDTLADCPASVFLSAADPTPGACDEQVECVAGACVVSTSEDGSPCSFAGSDASCYSGGVCLAGECVGASPISCALCTHCQSGSCVHDPDADTACAEAVDDPCKTAHCDATAAGGCTLTNLADDTPCDDEDPCTSQGVCAAGTCQTQLDPSSAECCPAGQIFQGSQCVPCPCLNGGTCVAASTAPFFTCDCADGFGGDLCQQGCPGGSPSCSDHGDCITDPGNSNAAVCDCDAGWYGEACDGQCSLCSGNGSCRDGRGGDGSCVCDTGYFGQQCDGECPGGATSPCNDNGLCDQTDGTCACSTGFVGPACQYQCPGTLTSTTCSGHGSCQLNANQDGAECVCQSGYYGAACDLACSSCVNGRCGADTAGVCECFDGFVGTHCDLTCPRGTGNAVCSDVGVCLERSGAAACVCPAGRTGDACEQTCNPGDSSCTPVGLCVGNTINCAPNGVCDPQSDQCVCLDGFFGSPACADSCPGPTLGGDVCSDNGFCDDGRTGSGTCQCDAGYWGDDCAATCPSSNSQVCSGHGRCNPVTGDCTCDVQDAQVWYQDDCSESRCVHGYAGPSCNVKCETPANSDVACGGRGECILSGPNAGQCDCDDGYTGYACQDDESTQYNCPTTPSGGECNSQGICVQDEVTSQYYCACLPGMTGDTCQYACPGPTGSSQDSCIPILPQDEPVDPPDDTEDNNDLGYQTALVIMGVAMLGGAGALLFITGGGSRHLFGAEDDDDKGAPAGGNGLAVDAARQMMFWTHDGVWRSDLKGEDLAAVVSVHKASRRGSRRSSPHSSNTAAADVTDLPSRRDRHVPFGVAIDPDTGLVYWSDANNYKPTINCTNPDGGQQSVVIPSGLGRPWALVVAAGRIWWSDPLLHRISCADLDGSNVRVVVQGDDEFTPFGIAVAPQHQRLLWVDGQNLWSSEYDGSQRLCIVRGLVNALGIAVDDARGVVFWSEFLDPDDPLPLRTPPPDMAARLSNRLSAATSPRSEYSYAKGSGSDAGAAGTSSSVGGASEYSTLRTVVGVDESVTPRRKSKSRRSPAPPPPATGWVSRTILQPGGGIERLADGLVYPTSLGLSSRSTNLSHNGELGQLFVTGPDSPAIKVLSVPPLPESTRAVLGLDNPRDSYDSYGGASLLSAYSAAMPSQAPGSARSSMAMPQDQSQGEGSAAAGGVRDSLDMRHSLDTGSSLHIRNSLDTRDMASAQSAAMPSLAPGSVYTSRSQRSRPGTMDTTMMSAVSAAMTGNMGADDIGSVRSSDSGGSDSSGGGGGADAPIVVVGTDDTNSHAQLVHQTAAIGREAANAMADRMRSRENVAMSSVASVTSGSSSDDGASAMSVVSDDDDSASVQSMVSAKPVESVVPGGLENARTATGAASTGAASAASSRRSKGKKQAGKPPRPQKPLASAAYAAASGSRNSSLGSAAQAPSSDEVRQRARGLVRVPSIGSRASLASVEKPGPRGVVAGISQRMVEPDIGDDGGVERPQLSRGMGHARSGSNATNGSTGSSGIMASVTAFMHRQKRRDQDHAQINKYYHVQEPGRVASTASKRSRDSCASGQHALVAAMRGDRPPAGFQPHPAADGPRRKVAPPPRKPVTPESGRDRGASLVSSTSNASASSGASDVSMFSSDLKKTKGSKGKGKARRSSSASGRSRRSRRSAGAAPPVGAVQVASGSSGKQPLPAPVQETGYVTVATLSVPPPLASAYTQDGKGDGKGNGSDDETRSMITASSAGSYVSAASQYTTAPTLHDKLTEGEQPNGIAAWFSNLWDLVRSTAPIFGGSDAGTASDNKASAPPAPAAEAAPAPGPHSAGAGPADEAAPDDASDAGSNGSQESSPGMLDVIFGWFRTLFDDDDADAAGKANAQTADNESLATASAAPTMVSNASTVFTQAERIARGASVRSVRSGHSSASDVSSGLTRTAAAGATYASGVASVSASSISADAAPGAGSVSASSVGRDSVNTFVAESAESLASVGVAVSASHPVTVISAARPSVVPTSPPPGTQEQAMIASRVADDLASLGRGATVIERLSAAGSRGSRRSRRTNSSRRSRRSASQQTGSMLSRRSRTASIEVVEPEPPHTVDQEVVMMDSATSSRTASDVDMRSTASTRSVGIIDRIGELGAGIGAGISSTLNNCFGDEDEQQQQQPATAAGSSTEDISVRTMRSGASRSSWRSGSQASYRSSGSMASMKSGASQASYNSAGSVAAPVAGASARRSPPRREQPRAAAPATQPVAVASVGHARTAAPPQLVQHQVYQQQLARQASLAATGAEVTSFEARRAMKKKQLAQERMAIEGERERKATQLVRKHERMAEQLAQMELDEAAGRSPVPPLPSNRHRTLSDHTNDASTSGSEGGSTRRRPRRRPSRAVPEMTPGVASADDVLSNASLDSSNQSGASYHSGHSNAPLGASDQGVISNATYASTSDGTGVRVVNAAAAAAAGVVPPAGAASPQQRQQAVRQGGYTPAVPVGASSGSGSGSGVLGHAARRAYNVQQQQPHGGSPAISAGSATLHSPSLSHGTSSGNSAVEIQTPPPWLHDTASNVCMCCHAPFGLVNRRHHCRHCGRLVDDQCSTSRVPLPKFGLLHPQRVCDTCVLTLREEARGNVVTDMVSPRFIPPTLRE